MNAKASTLGDAADMARNAVSLAGAMMQLVEESDSYPSLGGENNMVGGE